MPSQLMSKEMVYVKLASMRIMYISNKINPHIGGVEKHIFETTKRIALRGEQISIIANSGGFAHKGIKIINISYPKMKFIGLLNIWFWFIKNRKLFMYIDIIHIHDVFLWTLPIRIIFPNKTFITTFHGWEELYPIPKKNILSRQIGSQFSNYVFSVGDYVDKYYGIKSNSIIYGASEIHNICKAKHKIDLVYVGRLEENTGLLKFLKWIKKNPGYKVDFCGDGELRSECEKYGTVHGFTDPTPFYKRAKTIVPGGYLAALEALNSGCDIKLFWNNKLKEDYWKMSPFWKLKGEELRAWARKQTWDKIANEYLDLYNSIK